MMSSLCDYSRCSRLSGPLYGSQDAQYRQNWMFDWWFVYLLHWYSLFLLRRHYTVSDLCAFKCLLCRTCVSLVALEFHPSVYYGPDSQHALFEADTCSNALGVSDWIEHSEVVVAMHGHNTSQRLSLFSFSFLRAPSGCPILLHSSSSLQSRPLL